MRRPLRACVVVAGLTMVCGAAMLGQGGGLAGTWKANVAKSTYSPGPAPKSQTLSWTRVPGGFRFVIDSVSAEGQVIHSETTEKDDGSDAPVTGSTTGMTRYLRRIDDRTYEDGDKVQGKLTITRRLVIAPDGRTLTITMKGTNNQGQPVSNVVIYERQ
jgi:hypothetical protein